MFCTHCGTHLVSNFHFCGNCGTEVMNTQQTSSSVEQVKEKQVPNGLNEKRKDAKSLSQMTLSLAAQRSLQKLKKKEESTTVEIACQIIDKSGKSLKKVIPGPGGMTGKLFITVPSQSTGDVWLKALRQQYNIQDHVDMQLMEWKDSIGLMKIKPMDTSIPQLKKERTQRKMKCLLTHVQFTSRNRNQIISLFANEKGKTDKVEVVENLESCSKPLKRMHKMVDSDEELEDPAEASKTSLPIHIDLDSSDPSDEEMTKQPKKSRKKNLFVVHKTNAVSFAGASRLQKTIATSLHGPSGLQKQVVGNKDTTKTTSVPGPSGLQKTNATCTGIPGPSGLQKKKVVGKKDNTNTIATPSPGPSGIQNTVVEEIDSIALPKISYSSRCQEIVSSLTEQIKELRKKKQDRHLVAKDFVPSFPKPGEGVEVIIYDPDSGSQYIRQFDRLTSIKGIYNWIVAEVVPDEIPAQFQFVCLEGCQRDNCNHKFPLDPKTKDDILVENLPEVLCISKQDDQGNRTITCYDEVYFSYFDNI